MVLFTLTGLNVDVGLYEFIEYPTYDFPDISASYYLDLDLNPAEFDNIFYFKTTSPELTGSPGILADASDMAFKCESSYWPNISFSEGVISNDSRSDIDNYLPPPDASGVHFNKNIGVQWLAKNITGGYNNSDLFANEDALVQQYVDLDSSNSGISVPGIKELIKSTLDVSGGSDANPLSNADIGRNNVSREALLHLLDNDISANVQRVHNMIAKSHSYVDSDENDISFGDTSNLWIPIEFYDGDTIKFKLIYKPDQITNSSGAAVDDSGNALGTNLIEDQDYVVRLNIVGKRLDFYHTLSLLSDANFDDNFYEGSSTRLKIFTESAASMITQIDDLVAVISAESPGDGSFNIGTDVSLGSYIITGGRYNSSTQINEKIVIKNGTASTLATGVRGLGVNPNGDIRYMLSFIIRLTDTYTGAYEIFQTNDGKFRLGIEESWRAGAQARGYAIRHGDTITRAASITLLGDTSNNWKVISVGVDYGIENKIYVYENGVLVTKIDTPRSSGTTYAKANKDLDIGTYNQWASLVHFARIDILEGVHNYGPQYMEYIRETYPDVIF